MLQHTLIVGTTGSGKSYTEHLIIDRMVADRSAQLVLVDPKRMELVDYAECDLTSKYADNPSTIYEAIVHAYDTTMVRFDSMRRDRVKEWQYLPLYVFVDEMGALMNDPRHRKQYGTMLGDIAMMGRAARVFLVLCTQIPTRENLPNSIRDNMTNKVCLRLDDSSRARYVLGPGSSRWYEDLPRIGKAYVRTPDMIERPERIDVDYICKVLDV
jgi:S-DNA-T family DNA segregation ATPase FtsK/SpoIIIE